LPEEIGRPNNRQSLSQALSGLTVPTNGMPGYSSPQRRVRHIALQEGDELRQELEGDGWTLVSHTGD